ncbi:MAG: hypothetical protein HRU70_13460 [Phycisphaeraceae bacterium]|nr:MAG: hypothetical protein HRU70_13460 [Phycisphaeraceae bacterium]
MTGDLFEPWMIAASAGAVGVVAMLHAAASFIRHHEDVAALKAEALRLRQEYEARIKSLGEKTEKVAEVSPARPVSRAA